MRLGSLKLQMFVSDMLFPHYEMFCAAPLLSYHIASVCFTQAMCQTCQVTTLQPESEESVTQPSQHKPPALAL